MNDIRWLDSMSVGVAQFNDDHRRIMTLLGEIGELAEGGEIPAAIAVADQLIALATEHIEREDAFLRKVEFPGAENVIGVQRRNLANLTALAARLRDDGAHVGAIAQDMAREFVAYLLRADINYKSYVEHVGLADC
ncbi:MAG: bacteriohemerythrin [Bacteroidales bacterium]